MSSLFEMTIIILQSKGHVHPSIVLVVPNVGIEITWLHEYLLSIML